MKRAIAILVVLLMAVPAFAAPYCAIGCKTGQASLSCCCSKPLGNAQDVLQAPPCCPPSSTALRGTGKPAGAPTGVSEVVPKSQASTAVAFTATTPGPSSVTGRASQLEFGDSRGPTEPLYLKHSVFRI